MEATILAHDQLVAGSRDVMVSGGMESMTNAPYLLKEGPWAATAWATTRSSTT